MIEYKLERFIDKGWYPIESNNSTRWTWSKKVAFLIFPHNLNGYSLVLSGCLKMSSDLTFYYKNNIIASYTVSESQTFINIPPRIISCKIEVEKPWVPDKVIGNTDKRLLGVCLHSVTIPSFYREKCNWFPYIIEMGITGLCNIDPPCVMCATRNNKEREVIDHLPQKIVDKVLPYLNSANLVVLHGGEGEPLLSPKLFYMLDSIDSRKVNVMFASNGLLLTEDISKRLIEKGLKEINFSIDAATSLSYRKIRNNDGFNAFRQELPALLAQG